MTQPHYRKVNTDRFEQGQARRAAFLEHFAEHKDITAACDHVGVAVTTYGKWRYRFPDFAALVDAAKPGGDPTDNLRVWTKGFAEFRRHYFGFESAWFHLVMIEAFETAPPGSITVINLPPEHGKTTLFEDYANYKLAVAPQYRFTVGSESATMSKKIVGRVRTRMGPSSSARQYVRDWGPFAPQIGRSDQPWGASHFNVFKKAGGGDERDYSMVGLGITSQIAGTRTDHLHIDDVQSLNNLAQGPQIFEKIRQDWLSRPGRKGRTFLVGTRVGPDDVFELADEAFSGLGPLYRVILFPAIYRYSDGTVGPLWAYDEENDVGHTMETLEAERAKAGEEAWARNWMQAPLASKIKAFTDDTFEHAYQPLRSFLHAHPPQPHANYILTLDPGIAPSKNVVTAIECHDTYMAPTVIDERTDRANNRDIALQIESVCQQVARNGARIIELVIETMAFQKGLETDPDIVALSKRFGFRIAPHLTGHNKHDENIGVSSMAGAFIGGSIQLPYGDEATRFEIDELVRQFKTWRPHVRGNRLRQDRVMGLWFGWIRWRELALNDTDVAEGDDAFTYEGLPWAPTSSGLLAPTSYGR